MPEDAEKQHDPDATIPMAAPIPTAGIKETPDLPLPEALAKLLPEGTYTVEGFLGQGGMGAVYRGTQVRLQRQVAIKIMWRDRAKDQGFEERFRREALAMAQLNHPNIVNVIDYGEAGPEYLYIVMELIDGTDLVGVIRSGQMTQETALKLLPQICDALQFAHDNGIVHRDIKPANILLTRDGRIKMADFGLAKRFDAENSYRTQSGYGMGTPDYAAPEQFMGDGHVDHRADIYALGVMIYQMVTGTLPRGAWKPPSEKADVDAYWDKIVSHALQTDPHDRYASVSEIKSDISSILLPTSGQAGVTGSAISRKSRVSGNLGGSTTVLTQAGGRPAGQTRTLVGAGDVQPTKSSRSSMLMAAALVVIAVGGYLGWEKFRTPANSSAAAASATPEKPAPPAPIRLWDAADKIPIEPGVAWEDDALRLDNVPVKHLFPVIHRVAVKAAIRVNSDTEGFNLTLHKGSGDVGMYLLNVNPGSAVLGLYARWNADKERLLKFWKLPRQYRPGEWLCVEMRVVDGEISVSLDGKLLGMVHDSTFSEFTVFGLWGKSNVHFRDIEMTPLDPSWTNQPQAAPAIPVTVTTAEEAQRPVPKPASWVDATAQVRDAVVQDGSGTVQGDWLVLTKRYHRAHLDGKILRDAAVRMSFKGVASITLRSSLETSLSYRCVLNPNRSLALFCCHELSSTQVHFNKVVKLEPDFDLMAEHELVMAAEGDLISVWLDGRLMLSQRDGNLAQGRIGVIYSVPGSYASLHPHIKKVEYADLGGTPSLSASQSAVSRTWQAPTHTVTAGTEWTNLIPHIKPERDVIRGGWTVDEKGLTAKRAEWAICNLPVQDPGTDYDLRYKVTRGEGSHLAMFFAFRKGSAGGYVPIDYIGGGAEFADGQRLATLEDLTHLEMRDAATIKAKRKEWLPRGKSCTVLLQVREKEVIVSVNDEEAFRWPAEWSKLQQRGGAGGSMFLDVTGGPIFGVGIFNCEAVFHSIEMRKMPVAPIGELGSIPHLLTSPDFEWTAPVNLGPLVNSPNVDLGPMVSPDGLHLVFSSQREGDAELFECRRSSADAPWSTPSRVFPSIEEGHQDQPWMSPDELRLIYHATTGPGHHGTLPEGDIYFRQRPARDQPWQPPVNLGSKINHPGHDVAARLSSDERTLLFTSTRPGGGGAWDVWRATRTAREALFGQAENAGSDINTAEADFHATFTTDDRTLLFLRGSRDLNFCRLFMATPNAKGQYQTTALDFPITGKLHNPWLSADGRTLWFSWNGPGSQGVMDLWEIRRVPKAKKNPPAPGKTSVPSTAATKDAPFENTLGMKFVPVPITGGPTDGKRVLFSVWETRVQDYEAFVKETKREWGKVPFEQGPTHPVVGANWDDALAFCAWLTDQERKAGKLGVNERYRLPSDHEWSCAVDIGSKEDASKLPAEKHLKIADVFPWGTQWPPPKGAGNFAGEEMQPALAAGKFSNIKGAMPGYNDGFVNTSPVGSFAANQFGLHDMGGNVWQWCEDWADGAQKARVLRGSSSQDRDRMFLQSSFRNRYQPQAHMSNHGFRCVLVPDGEK